MKSHEAIEKIELTTLTELIKKIPLFKSVDASEITLLKKLDGWSNHNYSLLFDGKKYVLRLPVAAEEEGVNRKAQALQALSK
jgi:hypothetical protein